MRRESVYHYQSEFTAPDCRTCGNDYVRAGTPLSDGATTPADILAIKGPTAVQELSLIHILKMRL